MNLFFGGGLYGGFISFFSVLESLEAIQFPMAAVTDHRAVGEAIVTHRADTLLGMPSYLLQLFAANHELFKKERVVKKVFYGGEHFEESQKRYLQEEYGVILVRSAAYGSVDAGPLGYQCPYMIGSQHHLHHDAHSFAVVEIDRDIPAQEGRLLVTTRWREGQHIQRYDLGDLVRILPGECPCGRLGMRIELRGRHGDVVRIGSTFLNYARISKILSEKAGYTGELQFKLLPGSPEKLVLIIDQTASINDDLIERVLKEEEPDFNEAVYLDRTLKWGVERVTSDQRERVAGSGKLIHILERRKL